MADKEESGHLKRGFTLQDAAMFGVGGAVGSGILFAAAGGTRYAGPAVVLSWIIAAIMIIIITLPYAEFSAMAPKSGISARISYYSLGSYGGFLSGWALFLWAVMIPPIEAVAVATYASYWAPQLYNSSLGVLSPLGILVAILITVFFVLLNYSGVSKLGKFNTGLTWLKVAVVVLFIIVLPLLIFHPANFSTGGFVPFGWSGVFIAIPATGILFSFGGYRQVADMAGEIKNPKRNLPLAIGTTLGVQSILYVLMAIVIVGSVSWRGLKAAPGTWSSVASLGSPLADIMRGNLSFVSPAVGGLLGVLIVIFLLFAVFSPFGTFGIYLTGASRIIFGFAKEKALPGIFTKTNKNGVPIYSIALVAIVGIIFLIPLPSWYLLVDFVVVAAVVNFAIVTTSLPIMRKLYPDVERPFKIPGAKYWSLVAFIFSTLLIYWSTYPVTLYALVATLAGSIVFIYQGTSTKWANLGIKHSFWIPIYIIGLIVLSYIGGVQTGGMGYVSFPYDIVLVAVYAVLFWFISQYTAPKKALYSIDDLIGQKTSETN